MAEFSGRGAGKPFMSGPSTPGSSRARGRRVPGGRMVESRYLQYEKKAAKKTPAADTTARGGGKVTDGVRRAGQPPRPADCSGVDKGDLQSTLLEGHGTAPPDLDLSAINDRSMVRKTPQLEKMLSRKPKATSFMAPQRKGLDLPEVMEMVESQTLLLTLLTLKMENGLAGLEEKAEHSLLAMGQERARLQQQCHKLQRELLLQQRRQALAGTLDAQVEVLQPLEAVAGCFQEHYRTLAMALDTTRHELPVRAIHLEGDGQQLLGSLQAELATTRRLLADLGIGTEEHRQTLVLLAELRDMTKQKDLELQRSLAQVMELAAQASKEAALANQEAWEDMQGAEAARRWYFTPPEARRSPPGPAEDRVLGCHPPTHDMELLTA
ncbi:HAUS augmin-like complex subunit 8 isoform X2 [Cavia porcellus]|uniref:HAUS augmin-like complex subunit 8 isoform X2 n=1 Tax=Cavia porcellus TaxID=10141 RepID=UPI002FDFF96C